MDAINNEVEKFKEQCVKSSMDSYFFGVLTGLKGFKLALLEAGEMSFEKVLTHIDWAIEVAKRQMENNKRKEN